MALPLPSNTVLYEKRDRIAWITLNRPDALNAQNRELGSTISLAVEEATNDDDVLVAIITGAGGRAFCAGMDMKERAQVDAAEGVDMARTGGLGGAARGIQLGNCPKPVIAAIDGYCLGAGMVLALQTDIRIATEQSRFGMPEVRRSILMPAGPQEPEWHIPVGEAMWMGLTAAHMTARRAFDIGLVQALAPDRQALFLEAQRLAEEIKLGAPLAVRATKRLIRASISMHPEQTVQVRQILAEMVDRSEDRHEGPRAFAEKRAPVWKGR